MIINYCRGSRARKIGIFILLSLFGFAVIGGLAGFTLLNQAKQVKAQAKEVVTLVEDVPTAILSGDTQALPVVAERVAELSDSIYDTIHSPIWNVAAMLPVVGSDIKSAQTLAYILDDLADNALTPIADSLQGFELKGLFQDRRVNVEKLAQLSDSISSVSPAIVRSAELVERLPQATFGQMNDYILKVREPLSQISVMLNDYADLISLLPKVFGAGGSRTYLIIAQNNAELRSDGGLPGSVGFVTITDGYFDMGDFVSISHKDTSGRYVSETAEEYAFFEGVNLYNDFAQLTFLPEFERVGQLATEFCGFYWPDAEVDGVMAIDPTFLQKLMAMTGASAEVDGVLIDGTTAAEVLTHTVYEKYENDTVSGYSDQFFTAAADAATEAIFDNLANIGLKDIAELLESAAAEGHLYLWMADELEQSAVRKLSFSGNLGYDETCPELGIYLNDYTWSKIDWYLGCATYVGEGHTNAEGGVTYDVVTYVKNNLSSDDADALPRYITGGNGNGNKFCNSDAITRMYLFAPYGGSISDIEMSYNGPIEPDEMCAYLGEGHVWGYEGHTLQFHTPAQGVITITYKVNTAASAEEPLSVRQTPMAQEGYGLVTLAWEE